MGCTQSNLTPEEVEAKKKNKEYESQLAAQAKQEDEKIKLLLLGAGESGKLARIQIRIATYHIRCSNGILHEYIFPRSSSVTLPPSLNLTNPFLSSFPHPRQVNHLQADEDYLR